ncbi:hypothetical protein U1Q18_025425, partial [Sarracenia purpurea var. burkii]
MPASVPYVVSSSASTPSPPQDISSTSIPVVPLPTFTHNRLITLIPDPPASIQVVPYVSVPSSIFQTE